MKRAFTKIKIVNAELSRVLLLVWAYPPDGGESGAALTLGVGKHVNDGGP